MKLLFWIPFALSAGFTLTQDKGLEPNHIVALVETGATDDEVIAQVKKKRIAFAHITP